MKQMDNKTSMVIVLKDGEEIRGVIEWYDSHALKVHRAERAQHPPPEGQREVHVQGERGQGPGRGLDVAIGCDDGLAPLSPAR